MHSLLEVSVFVRRTMYSPTPYGRSGLRAAVLARKVRHACLMDIVDTVWAVALGEKSNTGLIRQI